MVWQFGPLKGGDIERPDIVQLLSLVIFATKDNKVVPVHDS